MVEALYVVGLVGAMIVLGAMAVLLPLESLVFAGVACVVVGSIVGFPAGFYYHVQLYRCLARRGAVPRSFVWHPTRYHAELSAEERRDVLPWFVAGALGFVLIVFGYATLSLGFLRL
jgi:hypothetical protein